jgi:two-component system LytT family response regulator
MQRLRALVVDDERLARVRLRRLLGQSPEIEIVAECGNGEEAIAALHGQALDVAFLDIQMPDMDGFDVLDALPRERRPHVIFVTAYSEHAVRAFEARALDYLLKPVSGERLRQAVERLRFVGGSGPRVAASAYVERLAVPLAGRIHLVETAQIDHVDAHANYVELHVGARALVLRETLSHLESRLDPARFLRVHRSRIVRLDGVVEAEARDSGRFLLRLKCGAAVLSGRSYAARIRAALGVD